LIPLLDRFRLIVDELSSKLCQYELDEIKDYVEAHEWGVAFEFLCTQLGEADVKCSPEHIERLREIGLELKVKPRYWEDLRDPSPP